MTSTIIDVKVSRSEPIELHEQLAAKLRRAIAEGEAKPGDRLPPASDTAAVAGVNKNTVLKALRNLREEGLLDFRRGRGVTVVALPQEDEVVERTRRLVAFARSNGYQPRELIELIAEIDKQR